MFLFRLMSPSQANIIKNNIGTIDYEHGEIKLAPINIIDTDIHRDFPLIEIDGIPCSNNVIGKNDLYLQLGDGSGSGTGGIDIDASCDTEPSAPTYGGNELVRGEAHFGCSTDGTVTATSETTYNADGSYTVTTTRADGLGGERTTYYPDGRTTTQRTGSMTTGGGTGATGGTGGSSGATGGTSGGSGGGY